MGDAHGNMGALQLPAYREDKGRGRHLGGEGLDGLQVEVVVQVEVVEVLAVDQKVEHVVALAADLQPHLHPVQLGGLEELGGLEGAEEVPGGRRQGGFWAGTLDRPLRRQAPALASTRQPV